MTKHDSENKGMLPSWSSIRKLGPFRFSILFGSVTVGVKLGAALCGLTELRPERLALEFVIWATLFAPLIWIGGERQHRRRMQSGEQPDSPRP
jgi:hypothetical protein